MTSDLAPGIKQRPTQQLRLRSSSLRPRPSPRRRVQRRGLGLSSPSDWLLLGFPPPSPPLSRPCRKNQLSRAWALGTRDGGSGWGVSGKRGDPHGSPAGAGGGPVVAMGQGECPPKCLPCHLLHWPVFPMQGGLPRFVNPTWVLQGLQGPGLEPGTQLCSSGRCASPPVTLIALGSSYKSPWFPT